MNSIAELKNETTLASIAESPESNLHFLLFAVVIDVSEPTKHDETSNFITKLKVIDPSFNYKEEVKVDRLKFHKFVHINIYSEKPDEAPKIKCVGDIIRLRRFKFKYTPKGELMGNDVKYSNWLVYSGKKGDPQVSESFKNYDKNKNRKLNKHEETRLSDLRDWADTFFFKNSLKYINWWNDWRETDEEQKLSTTHHKNIDLILKCKAVETGKKNKISFIDKDNNNFDLYINERTSLKVNNIIKLRCVEVNVQRTAKEVTRLIKLTAFSSCLLLPSFSFDYRGFDKTQDKRSPAKGGKNEQSLPFLSDFAIEDAADAKSSKSTPKKGLKAGSDKFITAIRKASSNKKVSTVAQLLENLETSGHHQGQKFIVKGYVAGFVDTNPQNIIRRMSTDDKKIASLKEKTVFKEKKTRMIYHFIMHVKDESVDESDNFLNIYALTGEYESHLFQTWNLLPNNDDIVNWNGIKEARLIEFEKKLKAVTNPNHKVKLVVELMITKTGRPFYRLVDTIFMPF